MTSADSPNATSSTESPDGPTPLDWQDGLKTDPYGVPACLVNRFPALAKGWPSETNATFGPLFGDLSPSVDLQRSLASKLRQRLDVNGSPEYALTWKQWAMPLGPPICLLQALARTTSGSAYGGWPTPAATESWSDLTQAKWRGKAPYVDGIKRNTDLAAYLTHLGRPDLAKSPTFRLQLMGYPGDWIACVPSATASSRKSRRSS